MELKIIDELVGGMPSWTEEAIVKAQTLIYFFQKEELPLEKQKQYAEHVQCKISVSSMQSNNQKNLEFGVVFPKGKEDESKDNVLLNSM